MMGSGVVVLKNSAIQQLKPEIKQQQKYAFLFFFNSTKLHSTIITIVNQEAHGVGWSFVSHCPPPPSSPQRLLSVPDCDGCEHCVCGCAGGSIDFMTHYRLVNPSSLEGYARAFVVEDQDLDTVINLAVSRHDPGHSPKPTVSPCQYTVHGRTAWLWTQRQTHCLPLSIHSSRSVSTALDTAPNPLSPPVNTQFTVSQHDPGHSANPTVSPSQYTVLGQSARPGHSAKPTVSLLSKHKSR